jgi:hypothetical protein
MGGAGGSPACTKDTDCGMPSACGTPICNKMTGQCEAGAGAPAKGDVPQGLTNVYGDCKRVQCDGLGHDETIDDPQDKYDHGSANECYLPDCSGGDRSLFKYKSTGMSCSGGVCDGMGHCVQCAANSNCNGSPNGPACQRGRCVPITCTNGTKDVGETDVDCGNSCAPCADGQACTKLSDCTSSLCVGGKCEAPACDDLLRNGNETDADCGGTDCPACSDNQTCLVPDDCEKKSCVAGICSPPPLP